MQKKVQKVQKVQPNWFEDVIAELAQADSGPQKTTATVSRGETKLEYVVRAVLFAKKMDTDQWERYAPIVKEAIDRWKDSNNAH